MKSSLALLICLASIGLTFAADDTVFREPFTLKLQIGKEHFYEENFGKIPFVYQGDVYLFKGDEFGLSLDIQGNFIRTVNYQPDLMKADVTLKSWQEVRPDSAMMMALKIQNSTRLTLHFDALMTAPNRKGVGTTSILPVQPGLASFESWPHPIIQLVLRNVQIVK
jgi:hypothetical protein